MLTLIVQHFTKDWTGHWLITILTGCLPLQGLVIIGCNPGVALYSLSMRGIISHIMSEGPQFAVGSLDPKGNSAASKHTRDSGSAAPLSSRDRKTDALAKEFCSICSLWKSENTVHCPVANICVKDYRGYNDLLGLPIGKYNHRLIMLMLVSGSITLMIAFALICMPLFTD